MFQVKNRIASRTISEMFKLCSDTVNLRYIRSFISDYEYTVSSVLSCGLGHPSLSPSLPLASPLSPSCLPCLSFLPPLSLLSLHLKNWHLLLLFRTHFYRLLFGTLFYSYALGLFALLKNNFYLPTPWETFSQNFFFVKIKKKFSANITKIFLET